ncbi:MAG: small multi-drug export protein [bacterium]
MIEGISPEIKIFLMSMVPVIEARGAIPVAIQIYGMHWFKAFILSVAGNVIPVAPILLILGYFLKFLTRTAFYNKISTGLAEYKQGKNEIIEKYETLGLMVLVSIPFPILGIWSAGILAFLLGVKFWHAFISISLGVFISGSIALILIKAGWLNAIAAALILTGAACFLISKIMFKRQQGEL